MNVYDLNASGPRRPHRPPRIDLSLADVDPYFDAQRVAARNDDRFAEVVFFLLYTVGCIAIGVVAGFIAGRW